MAVGAQFLEGLVQLGIERANDASLWFLPTAERSFEVE